MRFCRILWSGYWWLSLEHTHQIIQLAPSRYDTIKHTLDILCYLFSSNYYFEPVISFNMIYICMFYEFNAHVGRLCCFYATDTAHCTSSSSAAVQVQVLVQRHVCTHFGYPPLWINYIWVKTIQTVWRWWWWWWWKTNRNKWRNTTTMTLLKL